MNTLTLTADQQSAYNAVVNLIISPVERVLVMKGYAGVGKSTLVERVISDFDKIVKAGNLVDPTNEAEWKIQLTATTNKAAEALALITGCEVRTIQSFLGLRVDKNLRTGVSTLVPKSNAERPNKTIILIDEASQIDSHLLQLIFGQCDNCKLLFIGDPAQLLSVNAANAPVFEAKFPTVALTQVMRQAEGNPIISLATAFRNMVNDGQFFDFTPDGIAIRHVTEEEFADEITAEFNRPDWRNHHSKVLAWTNEAVNHYNREIRNMVQGDPTLQKDDYAVNNNFISNNGNKLKTDQLVQITGIYESASLGYPGYSVEVDHSFRAFMPQSLVLRKEAIKAFKAQDDMTKLNQIDKNWIDLRAAYACTVNKSQGSTYDRVFIDLNDIGKCRNHNTIARMLYVAVSRARHQVFLVGDLV